MRSMEIIRIESFEDTRLDAYARLTDLQLRSRLEPERGMFIAESSEVIGRALDAEMAPLSLLVTDKLLDAARANGLLERIGAANADAPAFVAPAEELKKLTGFEVTRGTLAAFRRPPEQDALKTIANAHVVIVLEDIRNHTNVGAAFRSAAALGADAVLVTPACYDPLYRRAIRVSMGAVFQVPWARIGNDPHNWAEDGVPLLHEAGFTVCALALRDDALLLNDPRLHKADRIALVFGTEGDGLAPTTIAACDFTVRIPMEHGVDSLNVAASTAVALWEFARTRQ